LKTNIHFWSYLAQLFLEWEMLQTNVILAENIKTHNLCTVTFLVKNRAVYGIIWKSIVEQFRPQKKICRMRIACWIPKATNIYIYIYTHTHAHTHAHTHTHTHTHPHSGTICLITTLNALNSKCGQWTCNWLWSKLAASHATAPFFPTPLITGSRCFWSVPVCTLGFSKAEIISRCRLELKKRVQ